MQYSSQLGEGKGAVPFETFFCLEVRFENQEYGCTDMCIKTMDTVATQLTKNSDVKACVCLMHATCYENTGQTQLAFTDTLNTGQTMFIQ